MTVIKIGRLRVKRERARTDHAVLPQRDKYAPRKDTILGEAQLLYPYFTKDGHALHCDDRAIRAGNGNGVNGIAARVIENAVAYLHLHLFASHLQRPDDAVIDGNMQGSFTRRALLHVNARGHERAVRDLKVEIPVHGQLTID